MEDVFALRAALDVETTGLSTANDRIKSIGVAVGNRREGLLHKARLIVDAEGQPSHPEALAIHGIPDVVRGAMTPRQALLVVEAMRGAAKVLMHHKAYDAPVLHAAHRRAGLALPDYLSDQDLIEDTMEIGKRHYPGQKTSLSSLIRAAGLEAALMKGRSDRHDSLDDAVLCFELWRAHVGGVGLALEQGETKPGGAVRDRPAGTDAAAGLEWLA